MFDHIPTQYQTAARKSEATFRKAVLDSGHIPAYPSWMGRSYGHQIECPGKGHSVVVPSRFTYGTWKCERCHRRTSQDCLYLVHNTDLFVVKFGITTRDPKTRLQNHRCYGYNRVVRVLESLPKGVAPAVERQLIRALPTAGYAPAKGSEYFSDSVLPKLIKIFDGHPELTSTVSTHERYSR